MRRLIRLFRRKPSLVRDLTGAATIYGTHRGAYAPGYVIADGKRPEDGTET